MKPSLALRGALPMWRPLRTRLERIWNSDSNGHAIVEMAVILPLMMLLITGMMSMGIVLNNYLILAHASDIGARYLALNQGTFGTGATTNPCAMAVQQIQAAATGISSSSISYEFGITTAPPTSTTTWYGSTAGYGASSGCATSGNNNLQSNGIVTVSVQYPVTPIIYMWSHHTINLTATTTELVQ